MAPPLLKTHLASICLLLPRVLTSHSCRHDMRLTALVQVLFFSCSCVTVVPAIHLEPMEHSWDTDAATALKDVLLGSSKSDASLVLIAGKGFSRQVRRFLGASRSIVVFEAARNGSRLDQVMTRARQVRMASWMVVVVVVSDDPVFLAAFAQQTREGRLLVWATRLIVVSRRVPPNFHPIHQTLALTNSLLLLVDDAAGVARATGWVLLPYQRPGVAPLRVASWAAEGNLSLHRSLFWDKFSKLSGEAELVVAMERNHRHAMTEEPDPTAPDGVRVQFKGFMITLLDYLAQGVNFSYTFRRPPDGSWGVKKLDGTFTGMVGQVYRKEADVGLGPFALNAPRLEAVDFLWPISLMPVKVFAGLGSVEVDPWGFVLPFGLRVWVALLALLFLLSFGSCFLSFKLSEEDFSDEGFAFVSIMFRQSVWVDESVWMWQRVVLGVWMLMTMVLTRSYEGNLMSLLAVRHLPQPYQTLRDVVDDPSVVMVWEKQGAPIQAVIDATSGIFYEVKKSEEQGRLKAVPMYTFSDILEEVISQQKVILDYELVLTVIRSNHFSRTGRCDLYVGHERIVAHPLSLISQKDSPLVLALSAWVIAMTEAGLYEHWNSATIPNSSACNQVTSKITISSSLSLRQCWAMLLLLLGGLMAGLVTLCLEMVVAETSSR